MNKITAQDAAEGQVSANGGETCPGGLPDGVGENGDEVFLVFCRMCFSGKGYNVEGKRLRQRKSNCRQGVLVIAMTGKGELVMRLFILLVVFRIIIMHL